MSIKRLLSHVESRHARKRRDVDMAWLRTLCEYHIESRDQKDYRDDIRKHLSFIRDRLDEYRAQFPDIEQRIRLAESVLCAPGAPAAARHIGA